MLALNTRTSRSSAEDGIALVVMVVFMFLGIIAVTAIAAAIVFTTQQTSTNRKNTQAFVAAESGRDAAIAAIDANIAANVLATGNGVLSCPAGGFPIPAGVDPDFPYGATVKWATATSAPSTWIDPLTGKPSLTKGATSYTLCPAETSNWVVVSSTGSPSGASASVDAVYAWSKVPDTRPAGTLAYFDGQFKATKSTYTGDLVIRNGGDYICNNTVDTEIIGDLWVTSGGITTTKGCYIDGNVYAYGSINAKNQNFHVSGEVISQTGTITLESGDAVIGGQIYAGGNVVFNKPGTLGTSTPPPATKPTVKAHGSVTSPTGWKYTDGSTVIGLGAQPLPTITPSLKDVEDATAWLDLGAWTDWGTSAETLRAPTPCNDVANRTLLQTTGIRVLIDRTSCPSPGALAPGNISLKRDVVYLLPASAGMVLDLTGTISKGAGDPQLFVVHADSLKDGSPTTCPSGADKMSVGNTVTVRTMIYSPCGINNTIALTLTGQLYMGQDGLHLNGGSFTCAAMGWAPAFKNLSCGVKGSDGIFDPSRTVESVGKLTNQTEQ